MCAVQKIFFFFLSGEAGAKLKLGEKISWWSQRQIRTKAAQTQTAESCEQMFGAR